MKRYVELVKETFKQWSADKASRLAASLSFYTMLSIAPLLVLAVAIAGFVFGSEEAQQGLIDQISGLVGPQSADAIEAMLKNAAQPDVRSWAGVIGIATLLWGASNVFNQLHEAMNQIWNVELKPGIGFIATIKRRLLSFSLVLVIGFLLLVSLILSAILAALSAYFTNLLPGEFIWQIVNFAVSLGVITLLFAMMYRVIPDVHVAWRDVWLGAFVTALLFVIGKQLLGFYLGRQSFGSTYGAAGSLVVLLVWIYYSAQIFFFGAEFTQIYATRYGQGMTPEEHARFIHEELASKPHKAAIQDKSQAQSAAPTPRHPVASNGRVEPKRKSNLFWGGLMAAIISLGKRRDKAH